MLTLGPTISTLLLNEMSPIKAATKNALIMITAFFIGNYPSFMI